MKITIFNLKGGQGKTSLSLALALSSGYLIVTNDAYSPIDKVLPKGCVKHLLPNEELPEVPNNVDLIYDFGGYPDRRVIQAVKSSDWLIVPVIYDSPLEMQTTIKTISELEQYTDNIIIVVNKSQKDSLSITTEVLNKYFSYPIFEVKQTTAFSKMVMHKKSIEELCKDNVLLAYHYKNPLKQIQAIQKYIKDK